MPQLRAPDRHGQAARSRSAATGHSVVRANRKTVTVPSGIGSWTDTTPWQEVTDHRTAEQIAHAATT